jgi:hypothetical protein
MSLFSWLFPQKKTKNNIDAAGSRMDVTRPEPRRASHEASAAAQQPANRSKGERMARRELLYAVVREAMVRAGVLSAGYKFKVLSLDGKGRHFLVMIDLSREYGGTPSRLSEIEAMIAQTAKSRHDITVTAVYWRMNEPVAVGDLAAAQKQTANSAPADIDSAPSPLESRPTPLFAPDARRPAVARYEPIQPDEVEAFKNALAASRSGASVAVSAAATVAGPAERAGARAFDGSGKHGPQSYTLLTGYEDTEVPDSDMRAPVLSGTQYGELN